MAIEHDAREVLRDSIARAGANGQVIFALALSERLPLEIASMYLSAEYRLAERYAGDSMLVVAVTLAGAVLALRAPMHSGDLGHFVELERRATSREQLMSGTHLCVTIAAEGLHARTIRPAEQPS
jgi:hypothetical protein